jgi:GNAT superfamily N-acetyltransferase
MEDNDQAPELQLVIENLPAGFDALREEARAEGYLFVERLAADWEVRRMRFDGNGEALLAAHATGVLAGIGGLTIEPVVPGALRMRRFYVRLLFRRAGVGRTLATALLERARATGLLVTVNAAPASVSFWESLGFVPDVRDGHTHLYRSLPRDSLERFPIILDRHSRERVANAGIQCKRRAVPWTPASAGVTRDGSI